MLARLTDRIVALVKLLWREVAKFGVVGGIGFFIDTGIFLWLITGPMEDSPVKAKIIATAVATVFSWVANRYWTFRNRRQVNVMRNFNIQFFGRPDQGFKIIGGSQVGVNVFVSSCFVSNGPRRSGIIGLGSQCIVFPFAIFFANGMNRRKIKGIETHFGNTRKQFFDISESSVLPRNFGSRSRKEFVPRAKDRLPVFHFHGKIHTGCNSKGPDPCLCDEF